MLASAGLAFEVEPSGVDEEEITRSLLAGRAAPQEIAEKLAEMKALRVSSRRPDAMVVGADSTLACNGRLFDKPPTLDAARKQLLTLRGHTHELFSSVMVARGGVRLWHWNERARLTMRPFTETFLDAYLARAGEGVLSSVGAYQLENLGAHLFSRVDGDYFTILGLPLLPLLSFLAVHGIGLEQAA
jgi:septum formation protein